MGVKSFRQEPYVLKDCWICKKKVYKHSGYCSKHFNKRQGFLRLIKRKGFFSEPMNNWSYLALEDWSKKTYFSGKNEVNNYKHIIHNLDVGRCKSV